MAPISPALRLHHGAATPQVASCPILQVLLVMPACRAGSNATFPDYRSDAKTFLARYFGDSNRSFDSFQPSKQPSLLAFLSTICRRQPDGETASTSAQLLQLRHQFASSRLRETRTSTSLNRNFISSLKPN